MLEVANRLRQDKIPADAIYLDIDYQDKNRPFTINTTCFPDMPGMVAKLTQKTFMSSRSPICTSRIFPGITMRPSTAAWPATTS